MFSRTGKMWKRAQNKDALWLPLPSPEHGSPWAREARQGVDGTRAGKGMTVLTGSHRSMPRTV